MKTTRLKCLMPGADFATVRSSAFRRFGWAPVLGRLKAELQTKLHVCVVSVRSRQSGSFALPILVALSFVVVSVLHAQSYSIDWFKVAGGGGTSTGGTFQVSGIPHCGTSTTPAGNFFSGLIVRKKSSSRREEALNE